MTTAFRDDCSFCLELAGRPTVEFRAYSDRIGTRIVWRDEQLVLLPSLGQVVRGHFLLVPIQHVHSFGELAGADRENAADVLRVLRDALSRHFAPPVLFEHGSRPSASAGGCGVLHAHVHVAPVGMPVLGPPPLDGATWRRLRPERYLDELAAISSRDDDYVFFEDQAERKFAACVQGIRSQFFRRWLAEEVGNAQWDWRQAGFEPNIVRVIASRETVAVCQALTQRHTDGHPQNRVHSSVRSEI